MYSLPTKPLHRLLLAWLISTDVVTGTPSVFTLTVFFQLLLFYDVTYKRLFVSSFFCSLALTSNWQLQGSHLGQIRRACSAESTSQQYLHPCSLVFVVHILSKGWASLSMQLCQRVLFISPATSQPRDFLFFLCQSPVYDFFVVHTMFFLLSVM